MQSASPEPALLAAARRGDRQALRTVAEQCWPLMRRWAYLELSHRQEAEDACQDALVRLMRFIGRYDPEQPFLPWLRTLVRNCCRDRRRQRPVVLPFEPAPVRTPVDALSLAAQRVSFHLETLDDTDPDLAYKYALHQSRKGEHEAVLHWADIALEHRTVWTGDTYMSRTLNLYKLRATAAQRLWTQAEEDYLRSPSAGRGEADAAHSLAMGMAREWYAHSVHIGKAAPEALELCMAALGGEAWCRGE